MGEKETKLRELIYDIHELIKPKDEPFTLGHIEMLVDSYSMIKDDEILYKSALQQYKTIMVVLEYVLNDEVRLINLSNKLNDEIFIDPEIILEAPKKMDAEELILLNYLYNLIMGALINEKNVNVKLYQKNNCLQKK